MGIIRRGLTCLLAACLPVAAWAEVVFTGGPLAVWQAAPGVVVAVGTAAPQLIALPPHITTQPVTANGLVGVQLQGAAGWQITQQGKAWRLTPTAKNSPLPAANALLLNTGWHLAGNTLRQVNIDVAGSRWQVGLTAQPVREGKALAGVVRRAGKGRSVVVASLPLTSALASATIAPTPAPKAALLKPANIAGYATIEPAAGLPPIPPPEITETNFLDSVQSVLNSLQVRSLQGLPQGVYQPGVVLTMPVLPAQPLVRPGLVITPTLHISGSAAHIDVSADVSATLTTAAAAETAVPIAAVAPDEAEHGADHTAPTAADHAATATDTHGDEHGAAASNSHGAEATVAAREAPLPVVVYEVTDAVPNETGQGVVVGVLIPPQGDSYIADSAEALQAVADAPVGSVAAREARLGLAGVYLAWQRPEEATSVLRTMPRRADGLPANATARLLLGLAAVAAAQAPAANVFDQAGALAPHANLWGAVAQAAAGNYSLAIANWPSKSGILPQYPDYLRRQAQQAQVAALLFTGQQPAALRAVETLLGAYESSATTPPALYRLKGMAMLGTPAEQQGLETLAMAAENTTDIATAIRAKFDFVRALHQRRDLSDAQLRTYLETLQQDWRGDETEREILSVLADLYEKNQEPQLALQTWKTLVQAFPRTPELPIVTARMAQAFVNVFDPETAQKFDPLTYLGLYYDFRELLPNDARGDRVQEQMAEALLKANLFTRAIPIIEQQLGYRPLDEVAQGRLNLLLAEAYRRSDKPEEAVKLLDAKRALATTQVLRRGWALTEARALADLQRPQAGAALLQPLLVAGAPEDREAAALAAQLAWQGQDWPTSISAFNRLLNGVPSSQLVSNTDAQLHVFRLAYALSQLNKDTELVQLKARYQAAWPLLPRLADDVNAVAATAGVAGLPPEGGPLQTLTTALAGVNGLNDQITTLRRDLNRSREQRQEYNRRMEYMELLPPPAL